MLPISHEERSSGARLPHLGFELVGKSVRRQTYGYLPSPEHR